jgi:hypothetical protein
MQGTVREIGCVDWYRRNLTGSNLDTRILMQRVFCFLCSFLHFSELKK